jgi:dTDP-4-amino-4,6-dideoxygalactose transaminase
LRSERVPAARIVFSAADRAEIGERVDATLRTGALTLGPATREFEDEFARLHRAPYAVAVSSGTAALEIILRALDVRDREVIVPANTFAATAFAVLAAGGRPVFADIDPNTAALDPAAVEAALSGRTAAVVLVHIGGIISPAIRRLQELCAQRGLALVEDAAHAHGCELDGVPAGSFGVAGAFSFYPTKVVTSGEGGMIVTADEQLRDEALVYRDQGKAGFAANLHTHLGYAWRLSELQAAVGVVHLRRLAEFAETRRRVAKRYTAALANVDGVTPLPIPAGLRSSVYKYIAVLDDSVPRAALKTLLAEEYKVQLSGEVYDTPLHQQPVFAHLHQAALPGAELFCARHICLPVHSDMTDAEAERVLAALAAGVAELHDG